VRKVRAPFEHADREDDFSGLVDYLDNLQRIPVVAEVKDWIVASVAECDPHAIAEVGCGNGDMSARFARACPDRDYSVGFDFSERFVRIARGRHADPDLFFVVSDGANLPCEPATFDALTIERVLMHIVDPSAVIAEAARVLADDGRLVICETDWQTLRVDHPDAALTTRILAACIDCLVSPTVCRQLETLVGQAGFSILDTRVFGADIETKDTDILLGFERMRGFALASGIPQPDTDGWFADVRRMESRTHLAFKVLTCRKDSGAIV
jgi:ubiquinone/menaquinone biosynthesis C-methylase UbiE